MKLIIDIPDEVLTLFKQYVKDGCANVAETIIANGIPLEQITAEIYEHFMTIDGGVHDKSAIKCMEIIGKYKGDKE